MSKNKVLTRGKKQRALALLKVREYAQAKALLRQVCDKDHADLESWCALVLANMQLGAYDEAIACCERHIALNPTLIEARLNLAGILALQGEWEMAEKHCRDALRINPAAWMAHYNLGNALRMLERNDEAIAAYREALARQPDHHDILLNLGVTLRNDGRYQEAIACYRRLLERNPRAVEANYNLGTTFLSMGLIDDAIAVLRAALRVDPQSAVLRSNLLFVLNNTSGIARHEQFQEHRRWGELFRARMREAPPHVNTREPERRLRVGYVSPDFRHQHSVTYFIAPLLAAHDRSQVELFAEAELARADTTSEGLRTHCDHWRVTQGKTDEQMAQMIRADRIDILVDLAGHTANSRLAALAYKPAPVQVAYLGYPNTSGLAAIDYRLTDAWADPPGTAEEYHSERLVRLPHGFLCYAPPPDAPPPSAPPAERVGHLTLGSFNSIAKVTPEVIALWASILRALPTARMILKSHAFSDPAVQERYRSLFADHGVDSARVTLHGHRAARADHLALYHDVDIALDPFPYNGTTTSCEALWMGVPVVTLIGERHSGRVGLSLLQQVGLPEFAAPSPERYRDIVLALAHDREQRALLRATLRERIRASSLCDARRFAADIEDAYRTMWRAWCENTDPSRVGTLSVPTRSNHSPNSGTR